VTSPSLGKQCGGVEEVAPPRDRVLFTGEFGEPDFGAGYRPPVAIRKCDNPPGVESWIRIDAPVPSVEFDDYAANVSVPMPRADHDARARR
jgi:hypothetical protein